MSKFAPPLKARSRFLIGGVTIAIAGCASWSVHPTAPRMSVDKEQIRAVIRSHLPEVQDCWQQRVDQGALFAHFVLRVEIVAGGGVLRASVPKADVHDEGLERCIADHALGWKFAPPDQNGTIIVEYPFVLRAD